MITKGFSGILVAFFVFFRWVFCAFETYIFYANEVRCLGRFRMCCYYEKDGWNSMDGNPFALGTHCMV